ncbi:hypothetical protein KC968_00755 [Candidatus Saccharibacteria bacterium]|nr:hypothetical protein [Candidatus Saccharibacteria bacterium]
MESGKSTWFENEASISRIRETSIGHELEPQAILSVSVDEKNVAADGIMNQPNSLAESSTTERKLERKHEVRDEASASGAQSVGSIVASLQKDQLNSAIKSQQSTENHKQDTNTASTPKIAVNDRQVSGRCSLYKQSVRIGFVAGLCVSTLLLMIWITLLNQ